MDSFKLIFFGVFALVVGSFLWRRVKYGSWTGAFLKGNIEQTYGEVALSRSSMNSLVLKIVAMRDGDGESFVGLVITAKAPLAASMAPYRLTKDQARELAGFLNQASR